MAKPTHNLFTPINKEGGGTIWHKIGAAWENSKGFSMELNSLPINGKIMMFPAEEDLTPQQKAGRQLGGFSDDRNYNRPEPTKPAFGPGSEDDLDDDVPF